MLLQYDPKFTFSAGFVIFYDLVLNLDPRVTACRLIVGLHGVSAQMGEPTLMPTVYTEPVTRGGAYMSNNSNAIIGARQPVPKYVLGSLKHNILACDYSHSLIFNEYF